MSHPTPANTQQLCEIIGMALVPKATCQDVAPLTCNSLPQQVGLLHMVTEWPKDLQAILRTLAICTAVSYWPERTFVPELRANMMAKITDQAYRLLHGAALPEPDNLSKQLEPYTCTSWDRPGLNGIGASLSWLIETALQRFKVPASFGTSVIYLCKLQEVETNSGRVDRLNSLLRKLNSHMRHADTRPDVRDQVVRFIREASWPLLTGKELTRRGP